MPKRFDEKSLRCIAISASGSHRQLFTSVLKDLGIAEIQVVSDIKGCVDIMEVEEIDWVIAPIEDQNECSVLQLLQIIHQQPMLRHVKVSIVCDLDRKLLPQAFALGALSYHRFTMTRDACFPEFKKLLTCIKAYNHDFTRVAASYLQDYLVHDREYGELQSLYTNLLQIYPADPDYLLGLAHAHLLMGEKDQGRRILQQVLLTGTDRQQSIRQLCREFFDSEELPDEPDIIQAAHFGFQNCLLVDPVAESLDRMEQALKQLGFSEIFRFQDPLEALKWLRQSKKIDLLISEWKLPNLPGPVFLYKVRHRLGHNTPLLIINEGIEEREQPFLSELGATRLLQKPFDQKRFNRDIIWTLQQHTNPTDPSVIKHKLLQASRQNNVAETKKLKKLFFESATLLDADRQLMEAQLAFDSGCYLHARKHALEALRLGGSSKEGLELLGKALMKLRDFEGAVRCLGNVAFMAPLNVSHLCDLAECQLEQGNDSEFDEMLEKAQAIDGEATPVIETAAKGAIKRGHIETARKLLGRLRSFKEVLAFMNNRAVTLIRVGNFEEGFDLYQRTLESLPDNQQEMRSLIHYNLGLGLARANRLEAAAEALAAAAQTQNPQRLVKVKSLKDRVSVALSTGAALALRADPPMSEKDEQDRLERIRQMEASLRAAERISRADFCLIQIYRTTLASERAQGYLLQPLTFTPRGKLVRDYHRGLMVSDRDKTAS